jgi:hypothetical protein
MAYAQSVSMNLVPYYMPIVAPLSSLLIFPTTPERLMHLTQQPSGCRPQLPRSVVDGVRKSAEMLLHRPAVA